MHTAKKALTQQLVAVLEPQLDEELTTRLSPNVIASVLRKLAKQVLQQSGKAPVGKTTAAKPAHKAVATQLTREVQAYWGDAENPASAPTKALTKTIKRLAKQVVKQQRQQPTPVAKPSLAAASAPSAKAIPEPAVVPPAVAEPKPVTAARRPLVKRAAQAVASNPGAAAGAPAATNLPPKRTRKLPSLPPAQRQE